MGFTEIICLANSRKYQGRCVAGLRTDGGGWIRPVGWGEFGDLSSGAYTLKGGTEAQVLDILRINISKPYPEQHQPENWLVGKKPWRLVERPASQNYKAFLRSHAVFGGELFGNREDRVPFDSFTRQPAQSSLALVIPQNLKWQIKTSFKDKRQTRARFTLGDTHYNLAVTDPIWEERLAPLPPGDHPFTSAGLNEILLTISLGEPFEGDCYKLVAAVIVLPRSWRGKP